MKALAPLIALALLLAGCSSSEPADDGSSSAGAGSGSGGAGGTTGAGTSGGQGSATGGTGSTGGTTGSGTDRPPTLTFSASKSAGNVPLTVNFTLDARDPEGKPLSWRMDMGDGSPLRQGTTLPATVQHNFTTAGNFTVTGTVSDGTKEANRTVEVKVLPQGVVGPSQTASLTWSSGAYGCGSSYPAASPEGPGAGLLYGELAIDPLTYGLPFTADFGEMGDSLLVVVDFYDVEGFVLDGGGYTVTDPAVVTGVVPDGAVFAQFENCGTEGASVTYTAA